MLDQFCIYCVMLVIGVYIETAAHNSFCGRLFQFFVFWTINIFGSHL